MKVEATTSSPYALTGVDTLAMGVFEGEEVAHDFGDGTLGSMLRRGEARRSFRHLAQAQADGRRVILVGLGERSRFDAERARVAAAVAQARARELSARALCWELPHGVDDSLAGALVEGTVLGAYRFDRYRASAPGETALEMLLVSAHHDVTNPVRSAALVSEAINRARDLVNAPANELTPTALADYARALAEHHETVQVTVMDEAAIRAAGMGAFAAVAQGSRQPAQLIELRLQTAQARGPRLGLVGKAVTFDTGGLSLKPAAKMHEMKFDMAGGAAVIETVAALAALEVPARVVAVVGATENMPSGDAVKPGDIVRAADGTTIEVNNTDAEGRLVLADCLLHARSLGCERLVDVATLTGGVVTALGSVYAAVLGNDAGFTEEVRRCGEGSGDALWPLPLHPEYAAMVKGRVAQLTNLPERREAATIVGAEFLHPFAGETPWAHLDIAGMAYDVPRPYFGDKGATGFGVRALVALARALSSSG